MATRPALTKSSRKSSPSKTKPAAQDVCDGPCPIERGMRLIGGKWKGSILWHLQKKPLRFNELTRQLAANRKVINDRLKELETDGLVSRTVLNDRPIAVEYALTELGREALRVLRTLNSWITNNGL